MQLITIIVIIATIIWLYILTILKRAEIHGVFYWVGTIGFFFLITYFFHDPIFHLLSYLVSKIIEVIGQLTDLYSIKTNIHLIYVRSKLDLILLNINYECSGVLELLVFVSLLIFYPIYSVLEKFFRLIEGFIWIITANILRILLVILSLKYFGIDSLFLAHSIISRILFYILIIILYYNVFTKQQIIKGWRNG